MKVMERIKRLTIANQANLFFGAIVMIATVGNVVIISMQYLAAQQSARESSEQTKQIIIAANKNAAAAESFAVSAKAINLGVEQAVYKLNAQAEATSTLAVAAGKQALAADSAAKQALSQATTARESFEAEARPYVGFKALVFSKEDKTHTLSFGGSFQNTGRVPALDFVVKWNAYEGSLAMSKTLTGGPEKSRFLNPGDISIFRGQISDPTKYTLITTGQIPLTLYFKFKYKWRDQVESKCEKAYFDPRVALFIEVGDECDPNI